MTLPFKKRLRYAIETAAAYTIYAALRILPLDAASNTGAVFFKHIGPRLGITRTARRNIARAFPEKSAAEHETILMDMWDNLGRVIGEYPHLRRLNSRIKVTGTEYLEEAKKAGGVIFFSAHLGNWEIGALVARQAGIPISVVYRKPNNPWVDRLLRHARDSGAAGHIRKGPGGGREILAALKKGETVGILVDQKMNEGIPVPFFGRDAMTAPAIATFALKRGYPVYPIQVARTGGANFHITLHPPLDIKDTDDAQSIMTTINTMLENWIRAEPGSWLWLHRRWPD